MTELATIKPAALAHKEPVMSREQIELLKRTIAKGTSDDQLQLFVQAANRLGLDPFARQIYAVTRQGNMTIQTSIDGYRLVAQRTGEYEGQTEPEWCGEDGKWLTVWLSKDLPSAARCGVYRRGFREPVYAVAKFEEYAQRYNGELGTMWEKMPATMIHKCAEALALRKAFPNELSGVYTSEEMQQADNDYSAAAPEQFENTSRQRNETERFLEPHLKHWQGIRDAAKKFIREHEEGSDEVAEKIEKYWRLMNEWWSEHGEECQHLWVTNDAKANTRIQLLFSAMIQTAKWLGAGEASAKDLIHQRLEDYANAEEPEEPEE